MLYTKNKLFKRILVALGVASLLGGIAELGIAYKAQNNQSQDAQNASSSLKPDYRLRTSQLQDTQAFKNEQLDGMTYPSTYSTVFMAYLTPDDVKSIAQYGQNNGYNRYIIWTLQGDMSPDSDRSLISAVNNAYQDNDDQKPHITSYWTNWSVYSSQHALKAKPYPIPGSYAKNKQGQVKVDNQDMANKLDHIDTLSYAFLEAQNKSDVPSSKQGQSGEPPHPGMLYFNDPWADLSTDDYDGFCGDHKSMCSFACRYSSKKYGKDALKMGNFGAFVDLKKDHPKLNLAVAIGGYGHDQTFEVTFNNDNARQNFLNSVMDLLNYADDPNGKGSAIDTIEMDYENKHMTHDQSKQYAKLIKALNDQLESQNKDTTITLDILASQKYINGTQNDGKEGFADGVLHQIANLKHVQGIRLMTYDFHGAFDYNSDTPRTGFLSALYANDDKNPFSPKFSIDNSITALENSIGDQDLAQKVGGMGIPTYARALSGLYTPIDRMKDGKHTGLYAGITSNSEIPAGNWDSYGCKVNLSGLKNGTSCAGMFSYRFIVNHLLQNQGAKQQGQRDKTVLLSDNADEQGFTETNWSDSKATTAFAKTWSPKAEDKNLRLTVSNDGYDKSKHNNSNAYYGFNIVLEDQQGNQVTPGGYIGVQSSNYKETLFTNGPLQRSKANNLERLKGKKDLKVKYKVNLQGSSKEGTFDCTLNFNQSHAIHVWVKHQDGKVVATSCNIN